MQNFFDRLAATAIATKVLLLALMVGLVCVGYWYWIYSDMVDDREHEIALTARLEREKKEYEQRKNQYLAFKNEVNALQEEQKELLRVLPKTDDFEQFIEGVQEQADLSGVSKVSFSREPPQPIEIYVKIPIRMTLQGTYHQVNRFFRSVGEMKRIVNIEDLSLAPLTEQATTQVVGAPMQVKATFVATTFQFQERAQPAPAPAPKPGAPAPGGNK